VLEIRSGDTSPDRLSTVAAELVRLKVDIIVAGGAPAIRAAKDATGTIPIVMRVGSDPVQAGLVPRLAHPVGNITGVASVSVELIGKRLELLLEIVHGIKRVASSPHNAIQPGLWLPINIKKWRLPRALSA
jgi:putative ABC transport system substrate-binding protein